MYVDLKKFILELAEKKEMKLNSFTIEAIRDAIREIEKNREVEVEQIMEILKKKDELRKGFDKDDWSAIEKEVFKMLKK